MKVRSASRSLESADDAETLEIRVVLDPVSYSNTCFDCTFEPIESAFTFAEQCQITCGII